MGKRLLSAILIATIACLANAADAKEDRIALLIGNKNYVPAVGPLVNPHNDIRRVADALRHVGFSIMNSVTDANRAQTLEAVYSFAERLKEAGSDAVGFFYYSGHGVAAGLEGPNYIVPIDLAAPDSRELGIRGVKLSEITDILRRQARNAAHFIVFDACRNEYQGSKGGKGFVPEINEAGMLIAFAAGPGRTASDQGDEAGPYASALAAELVKGQNHLDMFFEVRRSVKQATNDEQIPWTRDGLTRRVYFGSGNANALKPAEIVPEKLSEPLQKTQLYKLRKAVRAGGIIPIANFEDHYFIVTHEEAKKDRKADFSFKANFPNKPDTEFSVWAPNGALFVPNPEFHNKNPSEIAIGHFRSSGIVQQNKWIPCTTVRSRFCKFKLSSTAGGAVLKDRRFEVEYVLYE